VLRLQHSLDRGIDFRFDGPVLGLQVEERELLDGRFVGCADFSMALDRGCLQSDERLPLPQPLVAKTRNTHATAVLCNRTGYRLGLEFTSRLPS
jgi:hypothetical protein